MFFTFSDKEMFVVLQMDGCQWMDGGDCSLRPLCDLRSRSAAAAAASAAVALHCGGGAKMSTTRDTQHTRASCAAAALHSK